MTTTEPKLCPECAGPQLTDHPGGLLEIQHDVQCTIYAAEDATRNADYHRAGRLAMVRAATVTELALIAAFGYEPPDEQITGYSDTGDAVRQPAIVVDYLTPAVRRRTWTPEPETETP